MILSSLISEQACFTALYKWKEAILRLSGDNMLPSDKLSLTACKKTVMMMLKDDDAYGILKCPNMVDTLAEC